MSKELTHFLAELSTNPILLEKFDADPRGMLAGSDLSEPEKQLMLTRDLASISSRLDSYGRTGSGGGGPRPKKKKGTKKKPRP